KGLYNVAGSLSVPSNNIHANLAKGCVSCHMGSNPTNPAAGGHTFLMTPSQMTAIAECKSCHPDPEVFTQLTKSNEIKAALKEYRTLLINKGFLDTTQAITADGYQILGEYFKQTNEGVNMTKEEVEVTLNYLYLAKDRSNGAHNPNYMYALVKNGVEFLKK
ncbi:cytochrome c3 family protein, partial [bacterium]|nr:cytochrome c3 family protein [bacterium]